MSAVTEGEVLFRKVGDLGVGIVALGELLKYGKDEAIPDTLNGVGIVLRHLGESIRELTAQCAAAPGSSEVAGDEVGGDIDSKKVARLRAILDGAFFSAPEPTSPGSAIKLVPKSCE